MSRSRSGMRACMSFDANALTLRAGIHQLRTLELFHLGNLLGSYTTTVMQKESAGGWPILP
jgi:hypothetical protein